MNSTINIQRRQAVLGRYQWVTIKSIPIGSGCEYVCELMSSEYVTLKFDTDIMLSLRANDAIMYNGVRYYIDKVAQPTIGSNGGFHYEQQFLAGWCFWKNRKLFYNLGLGGEAGWKMTNTPEYFLQLICDYTEYSYVIDGEFTEMKLCDFSSSTDIISALNTMADDNHWRTEWWVDESAQTIHFGECKRDITAQINDGHIKAVNVSEAQTKPYTRIYAFGGTRNISKYYRKDLIFTAGNAEHMAEAKTIANTLGYSAAVVDDTRVLSTDVFKTKSIAEDATYNVLFGGNAVIDITHEKDASGKWQPLNLNSDKITTLSGVAHKLKPSGKMGIDVSERYESAAAKSANATIKMIVVCGSVTKSVVLTKTFQISNGLEIDLSTFDAIEYDANESGNVYVIFNISIASSAAIQSYTCSIINMKMSVYADGNKCITTISFSDDEIYTAVVNTRNANNGIRNSAILYNGRQAEVGETYTLSDIIKNKVPVSYYTSRDDAVKAGVTNARLCFPLGIHEVEAETHPTLAEREGVIIIDDIYPRAVLEVTSVGTKKYNPGEYDENGILLEWEAYQIGYSGITFKEEYRLPDTELHAVFQTGQLAGMDFKVIFNPNDRPEALETSQVLEIYRNDNLIPNASLAPGIGDKFVLYNYDVGFVDEALTNKAEEELLQTAEEIIEASLANDNTYELSMNVIRCKGYEMQNGKETLLHDDIMSLPIGAQVTYESALYGTIQSRIRKVQRALDDRTLKYTLGMSAPYSRYREIKTLLNQIK